MRRADPNLHVHTNSVQPIIHYIDPSVLTGKHEQRHESLRKRYISQQKTLFIQCSYRTRNNNLGIISTISLQKTFAGSPIKMKKAT